MRLTDEEVRELSTLKTDPYERADQFVSYESAASLARDLLACREMLRAVEWRGDVDNGGICPCCEGWEPRPDLNMKGGHKKGCALAALLGGEGTK